MNTELLKQLVEAHGIAGREDGIRATVMQAMRPLVDEMRVDALGNVIGHKQGEGTKPGTRVLIMGHMDEIGFLVSHIDDHGFLRVLPVGGWDPRIVLARRVMVHAREELPGVFGIPKPIHILTEEERKKELKPTGAKLTYKRTLQINAIIGDQLSDGVECGNPCSGQCHAKSQRPRECSQSVLPSINHDLPSLRCITPAALYIVE